MNDMSNNDVRNDADRVLIFDTTLRDGEQSPGISLNKQEKLEIAHQLARLGVDVIEAGFPITSPSDIHIERKLQTTRENVKGQVRAAVAHAREYTEDVEFSPEDGSRSDIAYMAEVIGIALDEGASTINVPDTVGYKIGRASCRERG